MFCRRTKKLAKRTVKKELHTDDERQDFDAIDEPLVEHTSPAVVDPSEETVDLGESIYDQKPHNLKQLLQKVF